MATHQRGRGFKHKCQNKSTLLNTGCSPTKKKKKWRLFTSPKLLLFRKEKSQTQPHSGSKRVCKLVQSHLYLYCNSPLKILSFGKKNKKTPFLISYTDADDDNLQMCQTAAVQRQLTGKDHFSSVISRVWKKKKISP